MTAAAVLAYGLTMVGVYTAGKIYNHITRRT
jgi:hypothetical protein